jgi:hypothetical protein
MMARTVASVMRKNPLATHWAAPMTSSVLDEDRLYAIPAMSAAIR